MGRKKTNLMEGRKSMEKEQTSSRKEEKERERRRLSDFRIKIAAAYEKVMQEIGGDPPRLICWLRGGVNLPRANKIREDIEKQI